ncbi:MAG: CARDB domain-containing protein [Solirubrobacterales bacterium]
MKARPFVLALAFLLGSLLAAPSASAKAKPDLLPIAGSLDKAFSFIGGRWKLQASDTTTNKGRGRAGPTLTRFYLSKNGRRTELTSRPVGGLKPGEIDSGAQGPRGRNDLPAGSYRVIACADAEDQEKETNEQNNCGRVEFPRRFLSAYEEWQGKFGGTGPGTLTADSIETWKTIDDVTFGDPININGIFQYKVLGGSVNYTFSGTSSTGCGTYSGSGTFALDRQFGLLTVDYVGNTYSAAAGPGLGASYQLTSLCGTGGWGAHEPALGVELMKMTDGASVLKGAGTDPTQPGVNYTWNLAGAE